MRGSLAAAFCVLWACTSGGPGSGPDGGASDGGGGTDAGGESVPIPGALAVITGDGFASLSWTADPGQVDQFEILVGTAPDALSWFGDAGQHATASHVSPLVNGTRYYFGVRAVRGELRSALAGPVSAIPGVSGTALRVLSTTPADDEMNVYVGNPLRLEFSHDTRASDRRVQVTPAMDFTISGTDRKPVYTPTHDWAPSTLYSVVVEATSSSGALLEPPYAFQFTTGPAPVVPAATGLQAIAKDGEVELRWTAAPGVAGYRLYRGPPGEDPGTQRSFISGSATVFRDTQVTNGTAYQYRLVSYLGNYTSPPAGPVSATPQPSPLTVVSTAPLEQSVGITRDRKLEVRFSEAVLDGSFSYLLEPAHPLELLGTSTSTRKELRAVGLLARETSYTLTVQATGVRGQVLSPPFTLTFTTGVTPIPPEEVVPAVEWVIPVDGASAAVETTPVRLRFTKPMDRPSVEAAFSLTPPTPCAFSWSYDSRELTCSPQPHLATDQGYQLQLASSARSADAGGLSLASDFQASFHTAGPPTLVSIDPADGARGLRPDRAVTLRFSKPIDCGSVVSAFHFTAPIYATESAPGCMSGNTEYRLRASDDFPYDTDIVWTLDATVVDAVGNPLVAGASGDFHTARVATQVLPALGTADGFVDADGGVNLTSAVVTAGVYADGTEVRGLLSFDLGQLPAETVGISHALLRVTQLEADPALFQDGAINAFSVPFGPAPSSAAFNQAVDLRLACVFLFCFPDPVRSPLTSSATPGPRSAEVTYKVNQDFNDRAARHGLSQFRIRTGLELADGGTLVDGDAHTVDFASGEAPTGAPRLEILYEYP